MLQESQLVAVSEPIVEIAWASAMQSKGHAAAHRVRHLALHRVRKDALCVSSRTPGWNRKPLRRSPSQVVNICIRPSRPLLCPDDVDTRTRVFFVAAFAWTWLWQAPITLGYEGGFWLVLAAAAAIGPSLAAVAVTQGKVLTTIRPRGQMRWYLLAFLAPPLVKALSLGADVAAGQALPEQLLALPALGAMILPPLGEELGWRGFAYPAMADRLGRVRAAATTGMLWALWHLPTAFWPGANPADFPLYFVAVTGAGIWMAWLYERAQRSVLVAIIAHMALNAGLVASGSQVSLALAWAAIGTACAVSLASPCDD